MQKMPKQAGREIRGLMSNFPCNINLVGITFKGGIVSYDPANPRMQIISNGQRTEF